MGRFSHGERNKVRKAYNRAQYLEERRDMMRQWGAYIAALEQGGKVIPGKFGAKRGLPRWTACGYLAKIGYPVTGAMFLLIEAVPVFCNDPVISCSGINLQGITP